MRAQIQAYLDWTARCGLDNDATMYDGWSVMITLSEYNLDPQGPDQNSTYPDQL